MVGWEWVLPASLLLPGSQQFGGVPIGLDEANKIPLTGKVSAAQDTTDGPGGGSEGQCSATQFTPGGAQLGFQDLRPHLPQSHKKKDFRQIKGHIHSETGLVDGSDGLWGRVGVGVRGHTPPHPKCIPE